MSETNTPQQPVLVYPQYPMHEEDEINLFELWQALVKQKNTIFGVTVIITMLAVLYVLLVTPIYKAETIFLPPSNSDIHVLRVKDVKDVKDVSVETVYALFRENLGSIAIRKQIFEQMKLIEQFVLDKDETTNIDVVFLEFNEDITLTVSTPKKGKFSLPTTILSLEGSDPVLIAEFVNRLAIEAQQATKVELISDIKAKVKERIKEIKLGIQLLLVKTKKQRMDEIERLETADELERSKIEDMIKSLRNSAKNKRLDEIERLETLNLLERSKIEDQIKTILNSEKDKRADHIMKLTEANKIAHYMGIKNFIDFKLKKISDSVTTKSQIMTDISSKGPQLYTLGYEALEAEISSLTKRTDDAPFIKELRGLEDKLKLLEYNRKAEQLKNRSNDDPYIKGLRGLEEKFKLLEHNRQAEQLKNRTNDVPFIKELRQKENTLAYFESIKIDPDSVNVVRLDQAAFPSDKKIKPKRKLIVILGLVLGLILGIFAAFIRNLKEKNVQSK